MSDLRGKKTYYFLIRCDKPITSFCVISEKAVIFDPDHLKLEEKDEISFEYPEDEEGAEKRKRGRKPQKKIYTGTIVKKSSMYMSS